MNIAQGMWQELEHELASTRRLFEALPADKLDYKPHAKSMSLGALASHIVESLGWAAPTVDLDVLDMSEPWVPFVAAGKAELLARFDENTAVAREAFARCGDEKMFVTWTMSAQGKPLFSMPRVAVLRSFIISHLIHHRGQLTVYLRLLDVPVPSVYGPTADFPNF